MTETEQLREQIGRIDGLVQEIEQVADPALRASAKELVQCVMELHRAGFERILDIASQHGQTGEQLIRSLAGDDLVSNLLVLYDLHPDDFETRVNRGIEKARDRLAKRGASLDLISTSAGIVRLRIDAGGHNCGSTIRELESLTRDILMALAPDAVEFVFESLGQQSAASFVPLVNLQSANGSSKPVTAPSQG